MKESLTCLIFCLVAIRQLQVDVNSQGAHFFRKCVKSIFILISGGDFDIITSRRV